MTVEFYLVVQNKCVLGLVDFMQKMQIWFFFVGLISIDVSHFEEKKADLFLKLKDF